MNRNKNVIALPVVPSASRADGQARPTTAEPAVVDLQARRRAAAGRCKVDDRPDRLTPGEVWDALNDERLVVHYQPQYDMKTGRTVSAEALARLVDTDGRLVYPDRFIDPVEQRDLIVPLGRAIIARVCADLADMRSRGMPIERIAINLSAYQLEADTGLLAFLEQTIAAHGLCHADLEFELTERQSLKPDCGGKDVLNTLAARGARIVIDDFGVGYSSVIYLAQLPVTAFKLDRSIVSRVLEDEPSRILIDGLLALARNMGLEVVAEGVETAAQNDYLARAGCPLAQGFGYARPMSLDNFLEHMAPASAASDSPGVSA